LKPLQIAVCGVESCLTATFGGRAVPESFDRHLSRLMTIGAVGTEMVAPIGIGLAIDYFTGLMPLFMIVGALLGLVVGIRHLIALNKPRPS
jgi:hypothetical protein